MRQPVHSLTQRRWTSRYAVTFGPAAMLLTVAGISIGHSATNDLAVGSIIAGSLFYPFIAAAGGLAIAHLALSIPWIRRQTHGVAITLECAALVLLAFPVALFSALDVHPGFALVFLIHAPAILFVSSLVLDRLPAYPSEQEDFEAQVQLTQRKPRPLGRRRWVSRYAWRIAWRSVVFLGVFYAAAIAHDARSEGIDDDVAEMLAELFGGAAFYLVLGSFVANVIAQLLAHLLITIPPVARTRTSCQYTFATVAAVPPALAGYLIVNALDLTPWLSIPGACIYAAGNFAIAMSVGNRLPPYPGQPGELAELADVSDGAAVG